MSTTSANMRTRLIAGGLLLLCMCVYSLTAARDDGNWDVNINSLVAWRIAHTGAPWMEGLDLSAPHIARYIQDQGSHLVAGRTPGQIWAAVPFYWGSSADQADFTILRGGLTAATLAALSVMLMFLALRRIVSERSALGTTAIYAFATPIWSVDADALWTHSVTVVGCAGAAWAASRNRWWLVGTFFGIGILSRIHLALIAAVVGVLMSLMRRSFAPAVKVGLASAAGLVVVLGWNLLVFDRWDLRSGYSSTVTDAVPGAKYGVWGYGEHVAGFLISPDRGLFVWTPALLILLPAIGRSWRAAPDWCRALAAGGLVYIGVQLGLDDFGGSDAFYGYRYGLEVVTCLAPLAACSISAVGPWARRLLPWAVSFQVTFVAAGSIIEGLWVGTQDVWTDSSIFVVLGNETTWLAVLAVLLGLPAYLATRAGLRADPATPAESPEATLV